MTATAGTDIQSVCRAHRGAHYCLFYRSQEDLVDLLAQYFKYGLENNEFCIWVAADTVVEKEARKALYDITSNLDDFQVKGQIEFANADEWYLKGGSFQSDRVSKSWYDKLDYSTGQGYKGMRVTGDLGWHDKTAWQSLMDYERHLNDVIPHSGLSAICSYPLETLNASKLIDIMRHHELAIIKNNGEWHILESLKTEKLADVVTAAVSDRDMELREQEISGLPILNVEQCNGCGLCIDVCETGLLYLENDRIAIRQNETCTWCTYCELVCPTSAIVCPFEIMLPGSS
jgi:ferredoxin